MSRMWLALVGVAVLSTSARAEEPPAEPRAPSSVGVPTYEVRRRDLQRNVEELKAEIRGIGGFHGCLYPDRLLTGEAPGSWVTIRHESEAGRSLRLTKARYFLNGMPIEAREGTVFDGLLGPGSHTLSVVLVYQGKRVGPFSYLEGYKLTVRARHEFVVGQSKPLAITIRSHERSGITTDLAARPAVEFTIP